MKRLFLLPLRYYVYLTALIGFLLALLILSFFPKPAANPLSPSQLQSIPKQKQSRAEQTQQQSIPDYAKRDSLQTSQARPLSYADAVQQAVPSVVNIFTRKKLNEKIQTRPENPFIIPPRLYQKNVPGKPEVDLGSGVIVSSEGHILTKGQAANIFGLMMKRPNNYMKP